MAGPQVFNFTSFTETYNRTGQTRQHVATQKRKKKKKKRSLLFPGVGRGFWEVETPPEEC